jgi:hypothetical protein
MLPLKRRCSTEYPAESNEAWSWNSGFLEGRRPLSSDFATASFRTVIMKLRQDLVVWEEGYNAGLALGGGVFKPRALESQNRI